MRLLILSSEFPPGPGGIGTHAYQVASHLVKAGWEIMVITRQDYASDEQIEAFNRMVPFSIFRLKEYPRALTDALYRWVVVSSHIHKWHPDIVMFSGLKSVWLSIFISLGVRIPLVAIGHGTEFGSGSLCIRAVTAWSFSRASAIVCVSNYTWRKMHAGGVRTKESCVIPNGADPEVFHVLPTKDVQAFRRGINAHHLLVTVGNVTERKGQDVVIRAMPSILREVPNTHYLIIGLPTKQPEYSALAKHLGVVDYVHFLGRVDTKLLTYILNAGDIFVMTSRHTSDGAFEGYGIAVVEAALCGMPSVVSANSGLAEAIEDGITGLCVAENDEEETAQAIVSLLNDERRRGRMGDAARRRALHEQTWSHRCKAYHTFLSKLLQSHGLPIGNGDTVE